MIYRGVYTNPPTNTPLHTPPCLAYTSEDSYVLIYKVRLEFRWGPRSADPPKMVKHDVFGIFSQRFPRTRFWVLDRCRVLGVSVCFHVKVLGSISKANAPPHTHTHPHTNIQQNYWNFRCSVWVMKIYSKRGTFGVVYLMYFTVHNKT